MDDKLNDGEYEEVKAIIVNGHTLRVGDKISCSCEYEVTRLYPVWHDDTKKHWGDHPANIFACSRIHSADCPLHFGK